MAATQDSGTPPSANLVAGLLRPAGAGTLHDQLEAGLRGLIESGELRDGDELPGEHDLAAVLGVSRHTIRHALGELAREGLLMRERGRGTRVSSGGSHIERPLSAFYAFAWEARARGVNAHSIVLERTLVRPPEVVRKRLAGPRNEEIARLVRVRTAGGERLVLETAYFPKGLIDDFDLSVLEQGSLYDAIERRRGLRITGAREAIRPVILSDSVADVLDVPPRSAAFLVERTTWAKDAVLEWQESVVRGDRFLYSVELPRRD